MKKRLTYILIILALLPFINVDAQRVFYDAKHYPLLGKISADTDTHYSRLPSYLQKEIARPFLWTLGQNSSGLAVRFRSDAQTMAFRWVVKDKMVMNHMSPTGVRGLDLYTLNGDKWTFVNSLRPSENFKSEGDLAVQKGNAMKEYMLYLPLYDSLTSLEIGVDSANVVLQPVANTHAKGRSIVWYGTSITQGACASRPGMSLTNILSRKLNCEIINMGFSANGQLDYEIAHLMSQHDASLYIVDCMPNVNAVMVYDKLERFYKILRDKHPNTPILFVQNPWFSIMEYDEAMFHQVTLKNKALGEVYAKIHSTDPNTFFQPSYNFLGDDNEASVDGIHFTDLGFVRCSEVMYPLLKQLLNR